MNDQERHQCDALKSRIAVLEAVLAERQTALEKAMVASDRAIDKAEKTVTARLEGFPQIYMTRGEAGVSIKALEIGVSDLRQNSLDKESYRREHLALAESVEKDTDALRERLDRIETLAARFAGGLFVVALIGIANLIKIWGG